MADILSKSKQKRAGAVAELEKGIAALKEQDLNQAKVHFRNVEKKFSEYPDIAHVARSFANLTEPRVVEEYIPETADEHYHYGVHLLRYNQPEAAFKHFEECLNLNPEDPDALYNIACFRASAAAPDEIMGMLDRVLELNPTLVRSILDEQAFRGVLTPEYIQKIHPPVVEEVVIPEPDETADASLLGEKADVDDSLFHDDDLDHHDDDDFDDDFEDDDDFDEDEE